MRQSKDATRPTMDSKDLEKQSTTELFQSLLQVMAQLRGPNGCPWDKKQTHDSLTACLLEETYEVLATIDAQNSSHLSEELGDLLLQVVFHAQIAQEEGRFSMREVLLHITQKLIRRHPHVFADAKVADSDAAIQNWEKIKATEKPAGESALSGVPVQLPALLRAYRLGVKAARLGFDWEDATGVFNKISEETDELRQAYLSKNKEELEEEFGDLLFALAQVARFLHLNPEDALRHSTFKFQRRFEWMEKKIKAEGKEFSQLEGAVLDTYWNEAKKSTEAVKKL